MDVDTNYDTDIWQVASSSSCEEFHDTDQECFQECWGCAIHSTCEAALLACEKDWQVSESGGCRNYYRCVFRECCHSQEEECLQGDDWLQCTSNCLQRLNTTPEALMMWQAVSNCVICEECPKSCATEHREDFHVCVNAERINSEDNVCYEADARPGQVACYSWAGWGGPCTPRVQACYTSEDCWALQQCYDQSWENIKWDKAQEKCLENVDREIQEMFFTQQQCIYCQACDLSCAPGALQASCEDYSPLY